MRKAAFLIVAALAVAFTAAAQPAQLASKALLEKRIYEATTNVDAKIERLRADMEELYRVRLAEDTEMEQAKTLDGQIKSICLHNYFENLKGETVVCTNRGAATSAATDNRLNYTFFVEDGTNSNPLCLTNAYVGAACWYSREIDGSTTNTLLTITTDWGETYNLDTALSAKPTYVLACSTNSLRTVRLSLMKFSDEVRDILLNGGATSQE